MVESFSWLSRGLMIVSDKYQFVYLPVPKTGSRSVTAILRDHFQAYLYPPTSYRFGAESIHCYHDTKIPEQYINYYIFASLRNPFDRAVSLWKHTVKHHKEENLKFIDFINKFLLLNDIHNTNIPFSWFTKNQTYWLADRKIDKFINLENIQADFNSLPFVPSEIKVPKLNISEKETINFTFKMCEKINEWAKEDFETLPLVKKPLLV